MLWPIQFPRVCCCRLDYANSLLFATAQKNMSASACPKHSPESVPVTLFLVDPLIWYSSASSLAPDEATRYALNSKLPHYFMFWQHQSVVGSSCMHNFCFPWFAAPTVCHSLPSSIRHRPSSTHTFCRLLKTHCFQQAFSSP